MKLLTQEILSCLPKLYTTEHVPLEKKLVICKFFIPFTYWKWYVFEGEKQADGDYLFFGMVHGHSKEMGYFMLSDITDAKGPLGFTLQRDYSIFRKTYSSVC